ncbi:hypothetical protein SDC9_136985 [bioreactor metagenome]|uniref:Uncharacterized protein n=1 Tax=bioreactor metagenome TaxID=1076179 RepID=A0A645DKA9_9ZZZZ
MFNELENLVGIFFAAVNHNPVCAGVAKSEGTRKGIFHAPGKNQAFNARNDHKFLRSLSPFARGDLGREIFDAFLRLLHFSPKQRILFKPCFVLNDHGGYPHPLEGSHIINEMLGQTAGISVKNNGFCGYFHDFIDRM